MVEKKRKEKIKLWYKGRNFSFFKKQKHKKGQISNSSSNRWACELSMQPSDIPSLLHCSCMNNMN